MPDPSRQLRRDAPRDAEHPAAPIHPRHRGPGVVLTAIFTVAVVAIAVLAGIRWYHKPGTHRAPSGDQSSAVLRQENPLAGTLVWSDEFNGSAGAAPSSSNWSYEVGGNGWGNDELECYTDSRANSALDGRGDLVITARSAPHTRCSDGTVRNYTSARLSTQHLHTFEYGRLVMRAELPSAPGTWPAFWALGEDHDLVGWPQSGEIDTVEAVGATPGTIYGSLHGPDNDGSVNVVSQPYEDSTLTSGFHIFAVDWTASSFAFSVDGKVYFTTTRAAVSENGAWVWNQPFYLLLDLAVGGYFPGPPTAATTWPQRMLIDYVRVYR